ncbi:MAG: phytanoyl-CoA dioxygenase family protein [Woeseiaceae bacterium]|nr:phytanoyl-CoA dioxygenase family protein [Woeseiaceae bacterium]
MKTGIVELTADAERQWRRIEEYGLSENVAELDALGYSVVLPDKVGDQALMAEARDRIIELAKNEGAIDANYTTYQEGLSYEMYHLVKQGEVFEKLLVNPVILALGRYLLGENMILNNSLAFVKGKTDKYLRMHSDSLMVPDPLPDYRHLINCTLALTEYSLDGGCIGVVPGSHRLRRHLTEAEETAYELMKPIECPAGSLIVVPGNTWHGSFPKKTDDLRVTLVQAYSRRYIRPSVSHDIPEEIFERNGSDFAQLLGKNEWTGFDESGFDLEKFSATYRSQRSQFS